MCFVWLHSDQWTPEFQVPHLYRSNALFSPINNTIPFCILPVTQRCNTIIIVIIILYYNSDEWGRRISQCSHTPVSQSSTAANSTVDEFSLNHRKGKVFFVQTWKMPVNQYVCMHFNLHVMQLICGYKDCQTTAIFAEMNKRLWGICLGTILSRTSVQIQFWQLACSESIWRRRDPKTLGLCTMLFFPVFQYCSFLLDTSTSSAHYKPFHSLEDFQYLKLTTGWDCVICAVVSCPLDLGPPKMSLSLPMCYDREI